MGNYYIIDKIHEAIIYSSEAILLMAAVAADHDLEEIFESLVYQGFALIPE